jgi:ferredoxin
MKLQLLKPLRVAVSLLTLALIGFLFLDLWSVISPSTAQGLLYLQFAPSLMNFADAAAIGAAGFVVVLILTALFGRVYCSALCPLGILQDVISYLARIPHKRQRRRFTGPHNLMRYSILALTVVFLIAGSGLLLNLLDPFSSFGRIFTNLFRPLAIGLNNATASLLEPMGVHSLHRVQAGATAPLSLGIALTTLALLIWLAAKYGRLYCNTLCPVGALLGLVSKISFLRIGIDENACIGCTLCEGVCKAGCIQSKDMTVDMSRCVACYNCLTVCKHNGLRFEKGWRKNTPEARPNHERRDFMTSSGVFLAGLAGAAEPVKKLLQSRPTTIPLRITSPVSPPGSKSIARFTSICTACHLCVSACPSRVLKPATLEFGLMGMMQPRMDFNAGHCNYDCTICTEICPSGALKPLSVEQKKATQLGVAQFIKENCVVFTDHTNCGACSEHCPTKAVDMEPFPNDSGQKLVIPKVNPDICVGCGGCEHACPTKPYKSIYVDGNPVHQPAQKPEVKKIKQKVDHKEDFPF